MDDIIKNMPELTLGYALKLLAALLILFVGRLAARGGTQILRNLMRRGKIDETLVSFTTHLAYSALMVVIFIAALAQVGIQTASFVAVLGAAGLAVGLSLQGSLSNFAAGVLIILFKPFKVGDFIEGGGVLGIVEDIGILTTELRSPDNKKIIVPNAKMMGDSITNFSAKHTRRVDLTAQVSYSDDLNTAKRVLEEMLAADPRVLPEPAPIIGVFELGDSGITFVVRPWVKTADYWPFFFDMQKAIKERFDAAGLTIPFPQRDVHVVAGGAPAPARIEP